MLPDDDGVQYLCSAGFLTCCCTDNSKRTLFIHTSVAKHDILVGFVAQQ